MTKVRKHMVPNYFGDRSDYHRGGRSSGASSISMPAEPWLDPEPEKPAPVPAKTGREPSHTFREPKERYGD